MTVHDSGLKIELQTTVTNQSVYSCTLSGQSTWHALALSIAKTKASKKNISWLIFTFQEYVDLTLTSDYGMIKR